MSTTLITPITHAITGTRTPVAEPPVIAHWQAVPLRLTLSLDDGLDLSEAERIVAEIHSRVTADPDDVLSATEVTLTDDDGPWDIDFTTAQMNLAVPKKEATYWLVIAAAWTDDDRIEVLAVRQLKLRRHNASLTAPPAPTPALYLTAAQAAATYAAAAFKTIAVSGQDNVVADSRDDTLTLAAGSGITITTNATTDTITIAASGGGGTWGSITGTISNQTDLQTALDGKVSTTTVAVTSGKVLTVSNTLTLAGTDSSTLNIGTGGTLGSAAFYNVSESADSGTVVLRDASGDIYTTNFLGVNGTFSGNVTTALLALNNGGFLSNVIPTATADRDQYLPDAGGTIALQEWVTAQSYLTTTGNGSSLTALNATQLTSGTVPDARFPATLPAASGANLTALNASNISSGTLADGRLPTSLAGKTFTSPVLIAAGTASAPALAFSDDADGSGTGIYRSAANELSTATNGTQRMRVAATGEVYITSTTASVGVTTGALVVSGGIGCGEAIRATGAVVSGALVIGGSGFAASTGGIVKLLGTSGGGDASRVAFQFTPSSSGAAIGISGTTLTAQRGDGTAGGTFATSGGRTKAIAIKTTTYTVTANDEYIIGNHDTVAFTVTLIAASGNTGRAFIFMNKGAANMTIDATSLGQITDSTASNTKVLTTGQSLRLISDGSTWISY